MKKFTGHTQENKSKLLWMMARVPFPDKNVMQFQEGNEESQSRFEAHFDKVPMSIRNLKELGILDDMLSKGKQVLDIGSGCGAFLKYFVNNGKGTYFGIEPESMAYDFSCKKFDELGLLGKKVFLVNKTLEDSFLKKNEFDYIVLLHVIEHVINPLFFLNRIKETLKPGGKAVIACPNVEGFFPRLNLYKWRRCFPEHRWLPGIKTLTRILESEGFYIIKIFSYGGFSAPRNIFKEIGNKLLKTFNLGDAMVILAEKNGENFIH